MPPGARQKIPDSRVDRTTSNAIARRGERRCREDVGRRHTKGVKDSFMFGGATNRKETTSGGDTVLFSWNKGGKNG